MQYYVFVATLFVCLCVFAAAESSFLKGSQAQPKYKINTNDSVESYDIAFFGNGNGLVVWRSISSYLLVGRIINSNGMPISDTFTVGGPPLPGEMPPTPSVITWGNTSLVLWEHRPQGEANTGHACVIDSQGRKQKEFLLPLTEDMRFLTFTTLGGGRIFISWVKVGLDLGDTICSVVMSFNGSFISNRSCIPTRLRREIYTTMVRSFEDGRRVMLVWEEWEGSMMARIVNTSGALLTPEIKIRSAFSMGVFSLHLMIKHMLILWTKETANGGSSIEGCVVDANGNITSSTFVVSPTAIGGSAVALRGNRAFVMWKHWAPNVTGHGDFRGKVIDHTGAPVTNELVVIPSTDPTSAQVVERGFGFEGRLFLIRRDPLKIPHFFLSDLYGQTFILFSHSAHSIAIN